MLPLLVALLILASAVGWIYGEVANKKLIRVISSGTCFVLTVSSFTLVAGFLASINAGVPMTEAILKYVATIRTELKAGNGEHVIQQLDGLEERLHVTYETGWFIKQLNEESEHMSSTHP